MSAISVILTTYNRVHYVEQALKSVFAQTFKDYELIVIDDGSIDGTREILSPYMDRMNYIWQENSGSPIGAKNTGLQHSKAPWVAYLDSDDIWEPRMLETRMAVAREHPDMGLIYGDCYYFQDGNMQNRKLTLAPGRDNKHPKRFQYEHFTNFAVAFDGVLFRRESLERIGQLDASAFPNADWDAIMRIALKWGAYYIDYPGVNVRIHERQVISDTVASRKAVLRSYREILSDFPELRQELGDVAKRAEAGCQWDLCEAYLRERRSSEAMPLLSHLAGSVHVGPQRRYACRLMRDVLRLGKGNARAEKLACAVIVSVWRGMNFGVSIIGRAWSWKRLPYGSSLVRRLFWNHKSEEALRMRGFTRTEDYYFMQDKLQSIQPKSVLDIGCGRGRYFPMYDQVERVVAIDISEKALARIPLAYKNDKRFHIKAMPVEELELYEPIDLVISNMVLAHVPPALIRKAIRRIARVTTEVVLNENVIDEGHYCFVHKYETLFEAEGFELIKHNPLAHGNVLYHFCRRTLRQRSSRETAYAREGSR